MIKASDVLRLKKSRHNKFVPGSKVKFGKNHQTYVKHPKVNHKVYTPHVRIKK